MSDTSRIEDKEEKMVGKGVPFDRVRRITGYLVGMLDRFNNAKHQEEKDRVKHGLSRLPAGKE